jgi:hypothetical protein
VNRSAVVTGVVPPEAVTVTDADPAVPGGLVAVMRVAEFTVKLFAGAEPKSTEVAPLNPAPLIVTAVPPRRGPVLGLSPLTMGP